MYVSLIYRKAQSQIQNSLNFTTMKKHKVSYNYSTLGNDNLKFQEKMLSVCFSCRVYSYRSTKLVRYEKTFNRVQWVVIPENIDISNLSIESFLNDFVFYKKQSEAKKQIDIIAEKQKEKNTMLNPTIKNKLSKLSTEAKTVLVSILEQLNNKTEYCDYLEEDCAIIVLSGAFDSSIKKFSLLEEINKLNFLNTDFQNYIHFEENKCTFSMCKSLQRFKNLEKYGAEMIAYLTEEITAEKKSASVLNMLVGTLNSYEEEAPESAPEKPCLKTAPLEVKKAFLYNAFDNMTNKALSALDFKSYWIGGKVHFSSASKVHYKNEDTESENIYYTYVSEDEAAEFVNSNIFSSSSYEVEKSGNAKFYFSSVYTFEIIYKYLENYKNLKSISDFRIFEPTAKGSKRKQLPAAVAEVFEKAAEEVESKNKEEAAPEAAEVVAEVFEKAAEVAEVFKKASELAEVIESEAAAKKDLIKEVYSAVGSKDNARVSAAFAALATAKIDEINSKAEIIDKVSVINKFVSDLSLIADNIKKKELKVNTYFSKSKNIKVQKSDCLQYLLIYDLSDNETYYLHEETGALHDFDSLVEAVGIEEFELPSVGLKYYFSGEFFTLYERVDKDKNIKYSYSLNFHQ